MPLHLYCATAVAFQLKIIQGKDEGKAYPFATKEARLGRTPENDIMVKDGGASRNHARVFLKAGRYFVEDLQSSNGTKLNGATIKGPQELSSGDAISIGEVTLEFQAIEETRIGPGDSDPEDEPSQDQTAPRARRKPPSRQAEDVEEEEAAADEQEAPAEDVQGEHTRKIDLKGRRASAAANPRVTSGENLPARASRSSAEASPARATRSPSSMGVAKAAAPESAAERARRRREASQSFSARLSYTWTELSVVGKVLVGLLGLAVLGAAGAGGFVLLKGEGPIMRGPEPELLGNSKVADSFGLGQGVAWSRPDMKIFSFELTSATQAVAVLRYQAADISQDEVVVMVNGIEQGTVPPDTLDTDARELELVLRPANLKPREKNTVMFDNTKNPPGKEPWKVWNLRLEIVPIPEVTPEELLRLAEKDAQKAKEFYDLRDVGPDNLFKSWKTYRNAWLTLEGVSEKPELYDLVRAQMRLIAPELDRRCRLMLLEAQRYIQHKKYKKARQVLDDVSRYFPTRDHRCQGLARDKIEDYEL